MKSLLERLVTMEIFLVLMAVVSFARLRKAGNVDIIKLSKLINVLRYVETV